MFDFDIFFSKVLVLEVFISLFFSISLTNIYNSFHFLEMIVYLLVFPILYIRFRQKVRYHHHSNLICHKVFPLIFYLKDDL